MMFQSRTMLLLPRRIGWIESSIQSFRHLSISRTLGAGSPGQPKQSSSPKSTLVQPRKIKIPATNLNLKATSTDRPRPRRVFDARSLAASKTDGQPVKVLRAPGRPGARGGSPWARKNKNSKAAAAKNKNATRGRPKKQRQRRSDSEEGDDIQTAEIENVYQELAEKTKQVPTRYQPQPPDLQSLSETWPSLPTGVTATTAAVFERLSSISELYPNGYVQPRELGRQLYEGQYVRFTSEEEKAEALEAAKELAQQHADEQSRKKGELVDPEPVNFQGIHGEDHESLIQSLAQGKYPSIELTQASNSRVVGEILRNLRNNETYQASGKRTQFITKLESLLASSGPVKRA